MSKTNPIRPTDAGARALARDLIDGATFAALAVTDPETGTPSVTRIALATTKDGTPVTLISDLAAHTGALVANPACALLVGEPENKGDPLVHPRLTLHARAEFLRKGDHGFDALRARYLGLRPKSKLYIDFADFSFARFTVLSALLNGGFGRAFHLTAQDLGQPV